MVPFVVKLLSLQQSLQERLLGEGLTPAEVVMALTIVGDHRGSVIALPGISLVTDAVSKATTPKTVLSARIASSGGTVLGDPNIANRREEGDGGHQRAQQQHWVRDV